MADTSSADGAAATGRYIAGGRVATGLALLMSVAADVITGPAWYVTGVVAAGVGFLLVAATTLVARRQQVLTRLRRALDTVETLLFALLIVIGPEETTAYLAVIALLMLVLAGLRGRTAFRRSLAVALASEAVRQALTFVVDEPLEPVETLIGIGVGAGIGAMVAHLVDVAWASEQAARRSADAATAALAEAEQAIRRLDAMHRVVASGIGSSEGDALHRIVTEIAAALDVSSVHTVLLDEARRPHVVATTDPELAARDDMSPIARDAARYGPLARALAGRSTRASPQELDAIVGLITPRGDISAHPLLRADGRVVGALVCDLQAGRTFTDRDHETLRRFADQTSLAVEAARSLDREAELARRYRELDRMKTDFIAVTSHELRTPLTTILGVVEMLDRQELGKDDRGQLLDALRRQTGRLLRLVDDLRTVSTVDAGTLAVQCRPTDLAEVVRDAVGTLFDVETALEVEPDLPPAVVDPERVVQIVTNLVTNGDQHGDGVVHLRLASEGPDVVLTVWDDGPGIPVDRRTDVFERFVRLGATNAHSRGTGLGLSITRDLTQAMRGTIAVVDGPDGAPSAFEVRLPAAGTATAVPPDGGRATGAA